MATSVQGTLRKMHSKFGDPVSYQLSLDGNLIALNQFLDKKIKLSFTGGINCVHCNRAVNKTFNQGYCYPCFQKLAQCDSCIIHPEKCHFDLGSCREPAWGERYCMQDHIVYLANSSGLKVGITRATQVPTRWIDQGAVQALAIIRVRSRLDSGLLEVMFKQHVADKTNWRDMLKGEIPDLDLMEEKKQLLAQCKQELDEICQQRGFFAISVINGVEPVTIKYPVLAHPDKINSLNFDKDPEIDATLLGIKGQYLIFDSGVINMRKFAGYNIALST